MIKIASMFSHEARSALREHLNIDLSDEHDYTADDLADLYDRITDEFPYSYDEDGMPTELGRTFEDIVDVFVKRELIEFNN